MEVHAHTHTPRKKWTHYFWEFLMLFLAVFLGFLAENQREHIVEHNRAKVYAQNFLKDLQNDTADIKSAASYERRIGDLIDSMINYIDRPASTWKGGQIYYYLWLCSKRYTVDWSKATLDQLINSGNLRYFTDPQLAIKISRYSKLSKMIIDVEESMSNARNRAAPIKDRIVSAKNMRAFAIKNDYNAIYGIYDPVIDSLRGSDLKLQSNDPEILNAFINAIMSTQGNRETMLKKHYPEAIKLATEIMDMLRQEYKLK